ncbi:hypothetical protein [Streptomyces sp. NPDC000351]|uniref:hypothetical protein n=1 Tax=Streptomyces sp. NPDC000351 TaxID=3154250 RepID=UPI00331E88D8
MEPADLLTRQGIQPARLQAAPALPARWETLARVQAMPPRPCSVCVDHDPTTARECLTWATVGLDGLCFKRPAEPYRPGTR